jgi:hypothetical protein
MKCKDSLRLFGVCVIIVSNNLIINTKSNL